ncbi:MAG: HEAT repeat domain-containing protein [Acidobacteria bacterium]|nr:HEAT repeat domain-containing protein [Acidobacteriota bacterium]
MGEKEKKFLADLASDNADVRYAAWALGGEMDPEVIPELAKLIGGSNPGVAKAAGEALNRLVHSVGQAAAGARRQAVVRGLTGLLNTKQNVWVRTIALRQLSLVGGEDVVAAVAPLLTNAEMREEAAFCLERIPGAASTNALMAAAKSVPDDFKPRILAALGHRGDKAAADLCAQAMQSPKVEIALAGMKALARIGVKPSIPVTAPSPDALSDFQLLEFADSTLRYAGAMARQGATAEAVKLYQIALARPEEHLQCAAIIGIGRLGTAEAAALIFPKLKSSDPKVRRTAQKVWDSLKGA